MFFWKPHYATEYRKNTDLLIGCIVQCIITLSSPLNCQVLPNELKGIAVF